MVSANVNADGAGLHQVDHLKPLAAGVWNEDLQGMSPMTKERSFGMHRDQYLPLLPHEDRAAWGHPGASAEMTVPPADGSMKDLTSHRYLLVMQRLNCLGVDHLRPGEGHLHGFVIGEASQCYSRRHPVGVGAHPPGATSFHTTTFSGIEHVLGRHGSRIVRAFPPQMW
ncbi:MAG: hypothetical protein MZV63_52275 [Marinilabiliales bacterium]|nr:hypothetical protein [Marinilabiliales bacterium]